jgi:hypothetical protein
MAHHKRKRPKNRRAGCLLCKPHKANGAKHKHPLQEQRAQGKQEWDREEDSYKDNH